MLRRFLENDTSMWISRSILAVVFLAYGGSKIHLLDTLAQSIHNYRMVPVPLENIMAITLPWIELLAAAALLRRSTLPGGATAVGGMLVVFLVAIGSAIVRGLDINCGCFTLSAVSPSHNNMWRTFILDTLLLLLTIHIWWRMLRDARSVTSSESSE
jgi:putative oxidoreductase